MNNKFRLKEKISECGFTAEFHFLELNLHNRTSDIVAKVIIILKLFSKCSYLWKTEVKKAALLKSTHSFPSPLTFKKGGADVDGVWHTKKPTRIWFSL